MIKILKKLSKGIFNNKSPKIEVYIFDDVTSIYKPLELNVLIINGNISININDTYQQNITNENTYLSYYHKNKTLDNICRSVLKNINNTSPLLPSINEKIISNDKFITDDETKNNKLIIINYNDKITTCLYITKK